MKNKKLMLTSPILQDYKVREAQEEDLEFLRICKNAHRESFFFKEIISPEMQKKWFADYQRRDHDFMLIVEHEKERVGCLGFRKLVDRVDIYNLIVNSERKQGKGYMTIALDLVCQEVWRRYSKMPITALVLRNNPALKYLLFRGFVVTAEHEEYFELTKEEFYHKREKK